MAGWGIKGISLQAESIALKICMSRFRNISNLLLISVPYIYISFHALILTQIPYVVLSFTLNSYLILCYALSVDMHSVYIVNQNVFNDNMAKMTSLY